MPPSTKTELPASARFPIGRLWAPLLIALAGFAAYANSFSGPYVFDDLGSIPENPTIRQLWPIGRVLTPPPGQTVSGRPLVNLSLAINYAFGGTGVAGYHVGNLLIHLLAGLTLFGIVRRTLVPKTRMATQLACAVALLWTLHPLQTESVTYLIQRAESLMGLFYLLTLYCFIRWIDADVGAKRARVPLQSGSGSRQAFVESGRSNGWAWLSGLCCLLGMASKEVMVSAPIIVLLYDRTFVAGNFRDAWRLRRSYYLGLAATWILLGYLVIGQGGGRSESAGIGADVSWWAYALTQFEAIARYLQLAVWPHPLVFEYGTFWVKNAGQVLPFACLVLPLVVATLVALWRWPVWGFLGFWFFAILAPTSLVPGVTQMIVEHRLYLALAPILGAIVGALGAWLGWFGEQPKGVPRSATAWLILLFLAAALGGFLTHRRNEDYRSDLAIWADTAAKRPENALAHNNLAAVLVQMPGRLNEALAQLEVALRLKPNFPEAYNNRSVADVKAGDNDRAIADSNEAIRLRPAYADAYSNRASAYVAKGNPDQAIADCNQALRLKPNYAEAHSNRADAYGKKGDFGQALFDYGESIRLNPDFAGAYNNLAWMLASCADAKIRNGPRAEALAKKACELTTWQNPDIIDTLAAACAEAGHFAEAVKWETSYLETGLTKEAADSARQRLNLYSHGQAYHDKPMVN